MMKNIEKMEKAAFKSFRKHAVRMQEREMRGMLVNNPFIKYAKDNTRVGEVAEMLQVDLKFYHGIEVDIHVKQDFGYFNDTFMANNKDWFEDVSGLFTKYKIFNKDFELLIFEDKKGHIVLDQIAVANKGQGLGTKIIDTLLNLCDRYDWTCVTVPTAIEDESDYMPRNLGMVWFYKHIIDRTKRLRNFYSDFGFVSMPSSAKMIYKPMK